MRRNRQLERWRWAGEVARVAMGKVKRYGEAPQDAAVLDPLAWTVLTDAIAFGGPPQPANPREE